MQRVTVGEGETVSQHAHFSESEIVTQLVARGVPRNVARQVAAFEATKPRKNAGQAGGAIVPPVEETPSIVWPVYLTIPWSALVSDNCRYASGTQRTGGGLLLTADYRRAKGLVRDLAHRKLEGAQPVAFPLRLHARVWVPDDTRAHDVCNFAKAVHDALETTVYTKDRWLYDVRWERAGVDVDAPRAEITIVPVVGS